MALFIFLLLLNFHVTGAELWSVVRDTNGVKIWLLNSNPDITASIQNASTKFTDLTDFEEKRRSTLSLIGVKNWKVSSYQKHPDRLEISGTYLDNRGKEISFTEIHTKNRQYLFSRPTYLEEKEKQLALLFMEKTKP